MTGSRATRASIRRPKFPFLAAPDADKASDEDRAALVLLAALCFARDGAAHAFWVQPDDFWLNPRADTVMDAAGR